MTHKRNAYPASEDDDGCAPAILMLMFWMVMIATIMQGIA